MKVITNNDTIVELNRVLDLKVDRPRNVRVFISGMMCSGPKFGLVIDKLTSDDLEYEVDGFSFVVAKDIYEQFGDFEVEYRDEGYIVKSVDSSGSCTSCGGSCS